MKKISFVSLILLLSLFFIPSTKAITCPLSPQKAYKTTTSSAVYYVTPTCTKRAFKNPHTFLSYFRSWSDVITHNTITSIPDDTLGFMPKGPLYDPQYGALVKSIDDPKVYLLLGTEKYWISNPDVFKKLGYSWDWIEDVSEELLANYTNGSEITYTDHHPNYTLITYADSNAVYRLEPHPDDATRQIKRHIKNQETFDILGFRLDRIVIISADETYDDGSDISASPIDSTDTLYRITGTSGGTSYEGAARIAPQDTYVLAQWQTSAGNNSGIGFAHNDDYFIAYGPVNGVGIALYQLEEDGNISGKSTINYLMGDTQIESGERLSGSPSDFAGTYHVTGSHMFKDNSGGGVSYIGKLTVTHVDDHYTLEWKLGGNELSGIGFVRKGELGVAWGSPEAKERHTFGLSFLDKTSTGFASDWITIGYTAFSHETWQSDTTATSLDDIYIKPVSVKQPTTSKQYVKEQGSFYVGARVEVDHRDIDNSWVEARILALTTDTVTIQYKTADGYTTDEQETVKKTHIRFAPTEFVTTPSVGDWVEYYYDNHAWYPGLVTSIRDDQCRIQDAGFSAGYTWYHQYRPCRDTRPYPYDDTPLAWHVGDTVRAKWEYSWYPAIIEKIIDEHTYTVISDDGYDRSWDVPSFFIQAR